jgi:ribonucleoside-triphosphate reductase
VPQKETYGEFQEEMNMINRGFAEVMTEGDANGRIFTFPIPTYNITKDFDWKDEKFNPIWEMTAKYGIPYFANFINSDMDPDDARSMCCRLRLDNRELHKRGGGLFGANPLTGSVGVVTINMPRLGYLSKGKKDFLTRLNRLMDLAKESLEIKRQMVERLTEKGLYPYTKFYLDAIKLRRGQYWANHFSTIGLVGMNEALLNLIGKDITTKEGQKLSEEILEHMRERITGYQKETGNLYNLEATPAEGTAYRLARIDRKKYPDIVFGNNDAVRERKAEPYYTNSSQLPVYFTEDIFEALDLQDKLQTKYTGGTVLHGFLGERLWDIKTTKNLVKKIAENYSLPYFTLTPTFSICPTHGYLSGEHEFCPKCVIEQRAEVYSRVVGYIRPVEQWNHGKKAEFSDRKEFIVGK